MSVELKAAELCMRININLREFALLRPVILEMRAGEVG